METITRHNLNLSPKYAPKWGAWEIAREFICNAIDADPEGYEVIPKGSDNLTVRTRTAPNLAELFMIGEGSKSATDENIGQFGEGAKIAALACTRGGSVEIYIPGHKIEFTFESTFGAESLVATICDSNHDFLGCQVKLNYPGIASASSGRILGIRGTRPLEKGRHGVMQVYCKGVWIMQRDSNSLFDWNIDELELNRDRSAIASGSITNYITNHGIDAMTDEQLERVVQSDGNNDETSAIEWVWKTSTRDRIIGAFERVYGASALMSVDTENNAILDERATQQGYTVARVSLDTADALRQIGVKETKKLALSSDGLIPVDSKKYASEIKYLRKLDSFIGAPNFSLSIFQVDANKTINGLAEISECRIWLSEQLFIAKDMHRLVQVYLHEVAHLLSGADDGTRTFEDSLDWVAATFAIKFLEAQS